MKFKIQNTDTEFLKKKKAEFLETISICNTYIDSVNGSFLGILAMKAEKNRLINKVYEITQELILRNEHE